MLTIEIVSDLVCPWCFIGLRRLSTAIEQVRREIPGFSCRKVWRPFFLNPDTPPQGEPYMPFLEAKFGSREAVEALFARVREAGRAYALDYAFERITSAAGYEPDWPATAVQEIENHTIVADIAAAGQTTH